MASPAIPPILSCSHLRIFIGGRNKGLSLCKCPHCTGGSACVWSGESQRQAVLLKPPRPMKSSVIEVYAPLPICPGRVERRAFGSDRWSQAQTFKSCQIKTNKHRRGTQVGVTSPWKPCADPLNEHLNSDRGRLTAADLEEMPSLR